ncbi:unnamed protein product [Plutella xylostella]|uniref:(diamondback moth) hypothetical protein n=1 Tax=Plutella xylostella TaxID=51655 RepID=A0A8S4G3D7_PLUXY|nr:unnamed protein product [Plutella xylostella]
MTKAHCNLNKATAPPTAPDTYPGGGAALRLAFSRRGCPPEAIDLMIASLSKSTLKQYSVCFNQWWQYCYTNNHEKFDSSTSIIIKFLTDQYNNGASYGTINSFRSALSLLLGNDISQDKSIKRLIKGVFRSRPSLPKYANTWDPQIVLSHISKWTPHTELSLEKLTKKLVTLLALCTAHRVQTFSLIKLSNIIISDSGVKINIVDLIKTSGPGRDQPVLYLPYFNDNLDICPATTLVDYISFTKELRSTSSDHLLITVKRPHRNATAQSISRWIKQVLQESGVDAAVFSAHSARHAATSAAHSAGLSLDLIRKTAGWTASSSTFAKYYKRPLLEQSNFAKAVCIPNNGSS